MLESGVLKIYRSNKQIGLPKSEKILLADTNGVRKQKIRAFVVAADQFIGREAENSDFLVFVAC